MRNVAEHGESLIKRQKCSLFCYFAQIMTIYQNGYFKIFKRQVNMIKNIWQDFVLLLDASLIN